MSFVDQQIAPFAHRVRPAETTRLIDEAVARFMPEHAREIAEKAAEGRYFTIDAASSAGQVSYAGTSRVHGELDLADALDLEDAVRRGAAQLAELGSIESLDVRRSQALGALARGDATLELPARELTLYVHLDGSRLGSTNGLLENAGGHLLTVEQIRTWCGQENTKITIKPVIDLDKRIATPAYEIPDRLREQVVLRDPICGAPGADPVRSPAVRWLAESARATLLRCAPPVRSSQLGSLRLRRSAGPTPHPSPGPTSGTARTATRTSATGTAPTI